MRSDRLGRVRVMRFNHFGATVAGVLSAFAPNLTVLVAARALAGGLFAAVILASLVYVGDTVGMGSRQKAIADLMAAAVAPPTPPPSNGAVVRGSLGGSRGRDGASLRDSGRVRPA